MYKWLTYQTTNFWGSEFDNIVSKRDILHDAKINQLKLEVLDSSKKDEKITTNFQPVDGGDAMNKAYLDEKLSEIYGRLSFIEKDYSDFKLHYNKQSVEEILI